MQKVKKFKVANGIFWIEIAEANLKMLCGCPADATKHLIRRGFIRTKETSDLDSEVGPNAILLSDISLQNGSFSNLSEFPIMHMYYKQGMGIPGHPNNQLGFKPLIIGLREQVAGQLQYIYRGNFGLISKEEMLTTGADPKLVDELMEIKLKFAYGGIKQSNEFIDSIFVKESLVEIRNNVFIKRNKVNVFEISFNDEKVVVDLNLGHQEYYEPPYPLGFYNIDREYFAVIHTGDGNGWDESRPCMASIIMFHGKIYLIDMGPNLLFSLRSLGIGVNEIEGVFHTHAHDDHFAGITTLIRGNHKIKYFASPLVRSSVSKKLAALLDIDESDFYDLFEVHDLELDTWNDIDELEVMPVMSPHPVETNVFMFRALSKDGYRNYTHLADIINLKTLEEMISKRQGEPGVSREFYRKIRDCYLTPANIKKIDIGGGHVHGNVEDFRHDQSDKLVLSHKAEALTSKEKEIGGSVTFGIVDILAANYSYSDFNKRQAYVYLSSYFPNATRHQLRSFFNNETIIFKPGGFLLKGGETTLGVYLILTGNIEIIDSSSDRVREMSSGGMIGDMCMLNDRPPRFSYRAASYVQAMFFPAIFYLQFIKKNKLREQMENLFERRRFLQDTFLLGDSIPYPMQNHIARVMFEKKYRAGEIISGNNLEVLNFIIQGNIECFIGDEIMEEIGVSEVFGEDKTFFSTSSIFSFRASVDTWVYQLNGDEIKDIPIVRWKQIELNEKRSSKLLNIEADDQAHLQWRTDYNINILKIDEQHKKLFELSNSVISEFDQHRPRSQISLTLDSLIDFAKYHFLEEEALLKQIGAAELEQNQIRNLELLEQIETFKVSLIEDDSISRVEFMSFFKDWLIYHILIEDRHYFQHIDKQLEF